MDITFSSPAARVLDTASKSGAGYADVQFWTIRQEQMYVRNGDVRATVDDRSVGYSVRAYVDGSWGFVGSDEFSAAALDAAAARAVLIAKSGTAVPGRIRGVVPAEKIVTNWETPATVDPAGVSLNDRAALLIAAEKATHVAKTVLTGYAYMSLWTTSKEFYSTTGSAVSQLLRQAGAAVGASAIGKDRDVQERGGPGDFGLFPGGGYEVIERAQLVERAPEYGREAVILADAPALSTAVTDLILDGSVS